MRIRSGLPRAAIEIPVSEEHPALRLDVDSRRVYLRTWIEVYAEHGDVEYERELTSKHELPPEPEPPAHQDVENSLHFVEHMPDVAARYAFVLLEHPSVTFCWDYNKRGMEVSFGEGEVAYCGTIPGGGKLFGSNPCRTNIPEELQELLKKYFTQTEV